MATRYVYGIYNTTVASRQQTTEETLRVTSDYGNVLATLCNDYETSISYDRRGTPVTNYSPVNYSLRFSYSDYNILPAGVSRYVQDTLNFKYIIFKRYVSGDVIAECYLLEFAPAVSGAYWHAKDNSGGEGFVTIWNNDQNASSILISDPKPFYKSGGTISKGSSIVSREARTSKSLTEGAYESNGVWRWRTYLGADNIDPYSLEYPDVLIAAGDEVTITVNPRTPTYGGTVYYQYSYSINGGSTWTNLGSRTTDTSKTLTIPQGAKQFQARVLASDNYGFTSTTYVHGPALEVSQLKAYVGVNGKARPVVKIYVGVNGKAREVVKGYIGVNGKARRFL